jgi:Dynein heavy chain region D6 P-loop domain
VFGSACAAKVNVENAIRRKDRLVREHEGCVTEGAREPLKVIEKACREGRWVMITSLRFPKYWLKLVNLLNKYRASNMIHPTFRLFLDLQGYPQNEIPDSFLFTHAVSFHLSPKNTSTELEHSL